MKSNSFSISLVIIVVLMLSGCSGLLFDPGSYTGNNIRDLKRAESSGKTKLFTEKYPEAFAKITDTLTSSNITIFQSNETEKYIVAMGFPKQNDTTRVGIFFKPTASGTKVTLSSLSTSALIKAEKMLF